eukprot:s3485_g9.t1
MILGLHPHRIDKIELWQDFLHLEKLIVRAARREIPEDTSKNTPPLDSSCIHAYLQTWAAVDLATAQQRRSRGKRDGSVTVTFSEVPLKQLVFRELENTEAGQALPTELGPNSSIGTSATY